MNVYERIYKKLSKIVDLSDLKQKQFIKLISPGYMDLNFDFLYEEENGFRIAIAHNYVQNGDTMCDPDMEIRINPKMKTVEAMTYQQDGSPSCFKVVYSEDGKEFNPKNKKELNAFLDKWLSNILNQNYGGS